MTRARSRLFRIARVVVFSVFAAVALEGIAIVFLPDPPVDHAPFVAVARHPVLGYALVPHQDTRSYAASVRTNSLGLREAELDPAVLADAWVVVCLGGSETFGKGVESDETYAAQLGLRLGQAGTSSAVTINAGVPDYDVDQSVLWFERYSAQLHPDVAILAFYWNDLFPEPAIDRTAADPVREWAARRWARESGLLELVGPIYTRSRVLYSVRNALKTWLGRARKDPYVTWPHALRHGEHLDALEEAWTRAAREVGRFAKLARARGVVPVLLVLPIESELEASDPAWHFQRRVAEMAAVHHLPLIDPSEALLTAAREGKPPYIPWDGRPSAEGHRRIAQVLLKSLPRASDRQ